MAGSLTLSDLLSAVRLQADQQSAVSRHGDADLVVFINQSCKRYRSQVTSEGWPWFVETLEGTLPVGAGHDFSGNYSFGYVTVPGIEYAYAFHGFEIQLPGGNWVELAESSLQERNRGQVYAGKRNATPTNWFIFGGNWDTPAASPGTGRLAYFPPADSTYPFRFYFERFLPFDVALLTSWFDPGVLGGEQWIVWDVLYHLAVRDHYPEQAQLAAAERDRVWRDLLTRGSKRNRSGPIQRKDTRNRRRMIRGWP